MISSFLTACLSAFSWISAFPCVLLLGEYPYPNENDYK